MPSFMKQKMSMAFMMLFVASFNYNANHDLSNIIVGRSAYVDNKENSNNHVVDSFVSSMKIPSPDSHGVATRYGYPGDKYGQQKVACKPNGKVNDYHHVCAHRSYPCGTILIIENTKNNQRTWCTVMDRGPYGANVFAGTSMVMSGSRPAWYIKIDHNDKPICPNGECTGRWRGVLDVSPAVSRAMGHDGFEIVKIWKLKNILKYNLHLQSKRIKQLI